MHSVRPEEYAAERLAHLLDDEVRIPGTRMRFGLDPLIGLIPVVGDVIVTAAGGLILFTAQRLGIPRLTLTTMAFNLLVNGLAGSIPIFGDAFSFAFKCHAKNAAALLRDVKQGEDGACAIVRPSLSYKDAAVVLALVAPIVLVVGLAGLWLWQHDVSLVSFLFPPRYLSRTPI
ncbi:MAG TPA: DUF4112 domain-containing protein [Nitrospiraceae bacterium]|nr:DUF4112 domain-containing protein [Nitrospiraceae bacterium]